jgi:hypothetical protein
MDDYADGNRWFEVNRSISTDVNDDTQLTIFLDILNFNGSASASEHYSQSLRVSVKSFNMVSKKFKKYIEVFMWFVLIFGGAIPSLRLQQLTIEHNEADFRRMSYISDTKDISKSPIAPSNNQGSFVRKYNVGLSDTRLSDGKNNSSNRITRFEASQPIIYHTFTDNQPTKSRPNGRAEINRTAAGTLKDWPMLETLVGSMQCKIIGDVQPLLDFAIIAHPKTATSNMQHWFRLHPEIQMHEFENHALAKGKPAELVANLYDLKPGWTYKRGYKAPRDLIIRGSLLAIATYWPKTKLIVGIRHPVLWFESFYNFRVHNGYNMPPPETLIGKLKRGMVGVATDESKFHLHLDNLGKTSHSPEELKFLSWGNERKSILPRMKNPVFLYEVNQLRDANETRAAIFSSDMRRYLGLENDFQPILTKRGPKYIKTIEICEPKHKVLRQELMKNANESSTWIRKYFLQNSEVTVSSPATSTIC